MDLARAEPHLDSIHRLHGSAPMMSCPTRAPNRSFSSRWRRPAAPRSGIPARGVWAGLPQFASVLREAWSAMLSWCARSPLSRERAAVWRSHHRLKKGTLRQFTPCGWCRSLLGGPESPPRISRSGCDAVTGDSFHEPSDIGSSGAHVQWW